MSPISVKLAFRFQNQGIADLDIVEAFEKNPTAVRDALCSAICQVALPHSDLKVLGLAREFQSILEKPWIGYKPLRGVLEACRQEKYGHATERRFYTHAQEEGVVALGLVAKYQNKLLSEIDNLLEDESIKLAKLVKSMPKNDSIHELIKVFLSSGKNSVKNPPPTFARPRDRSARPKLHDDVHEKKRRRICSLQVDPNMPSFDENDLVPVHPHQGCPLNNESHTQLRNHPVPNSGVSTSQQELEHRGPAYDDWAKIREQQNGLGHSADPSIEGGTDGQHPQLMEGAAVVVDWSLQGRPLNFDPLEDQRIGQEAQQTQALDNTTGFGEWSSQAHQPQPTNVTTVLVAWDMQDRPLQFDPLGVLATGQEEQQQPQTMNDDTAGWEWLLDARPLQWSSGDT